MNEGYHDTRLAHDPKRARLWRALWRYFFSKRVRSEDVVLDLGAGYGDFINSVTARRRIAVDIWPGVAEHAAPGVDVVIGTADQLDSLADGSIDYAFASNLFEHLTQEQFAGALRALRRVMSPRGRLTILQPNYRYAYREYFDDYTHVAVYSHVSLADFLEAQGWAVEENRPRFLPLTVKSRLPAWGFLIGAYLASPFKPMGKQMLLVARPRAQG
ncbi:MAG TPA: class I SAM-dependent methyltransferase [Acetobacteraceae bacterium]|nr:class I SAM-dependent methyltransferase [Acetobacteraceae bacterium]